MWTGSLLLSLSLLLICYIWTRGKVLSSENEDLIHKHNVYFIKFEGIDCIWPQPRLLICVFAFVYC